MGSKNLFRTRPYNTGEAVTGLGRVYEDYFWEVKIYSEPAPTKILTSSFLPTNHLTI
ncbi:hypothetical protein [Limnoraphis robusta]|uniref:hypothetical protein n=1 Tax=Limnoraphis robusta TaxID=1118279 RepID=UPI001364CB58|nr:hypothetical protein [Limnoraphis robusta]